jgi:hypothetical protein
MAAGGGARATRYAGANPGQNTQCANAKGTHRQQAKRGCPLFGWHRRCLVDNGSNNENNRTDGDAGYPSNFA